jgi:hypothetical protein
MPKKIKYLQPRSIMLFDDEAFEMLTKLAEMNELAKGNMVCQLVRAEWARLFSQPSDAKIEDVTNE